MRKSDFFNRRNEDGTVRPLPPQTTSQVAAGKGGNTQANLFVLPEPLAPWGTLLVIPTGWDQPTSPGKLSSESRMRKRVLQVSNDGS